MEVKCVWEHNGNDTPNDYVKKTMRKSRKKFKAIQNPFKFVLLISQRFGFY